MDDHRPGFLSTELANTLTHGIGLVFSIVGLVFLIIVASDRGPRLIVACTIYGVALVTLYFASTVYHGSRAPSLRRALRIFDHSAIYVLIAGTYTPFALVSLRGGWGWSLFGVQWGMAALGILFKAKFTGRFEVLSGLLYLAMGWMSVVAIKPLLASVPTGGVVLLFAGGLAYTLGMVFYAWKVIPHHHAVWHLFVMVGSTCHFFAVMFYVVLGSS